MRKAVGANAIQMNKKKANINGKAIWVYGIKFPDAVTTTWHSQSRPPKQFSFISLRSSPSINYTNVIISSICLLPNDSSSTSSFCSCLMFDSASINLIFDSNATDKKQQNSREDDENVNISSIPQDKPEISSRVKRNLLHFISSLCCLICSTLNNFTIPE